MLLSREFEGLKKGLKLEKAEEWRKAGDYYSGLAYLQSNKLDQGAAFLRAAQSYEKIDEKLLAAKYYYNAYNSLRYEESVGEDRLTWVVKAAEYYAEGGDAIRAGESYIQAYYLTRDKDINKKYLHKTLEQMDQRKKYHPYEADYYNLAIENEEEPQEKQKLKERQIRYYQRRVCYFEAKNDYLWAAEYTERIADKLTELGQQDQAEQHYYKACDLYLKCKCYDSVATLYFSMAQNTNDAEKSYELYKSAAKYVCSYSAGGCATTADEVYEELSLVNNHQKKVREYLTQMIEAAQKIDKQEQATKQASEFARALGKIYLKSKKGMHVVGEDLGESSYSRFNRLANSFEKK